MPKRFKQALKAGLVAYAISFLATALFVSPLLAKHVDFGHSHPQNTTAHTHAISDFFSSDAPQSTTRIIVGLSVIALVYTTRSNKKQSFVYSLCKSRAPPSLL